MFFETLQYMYNMRTFIWYQINADDDDDVSFSTFGSYISVKFC
jgi:glycopeptide antibiotics resistance protein